MPRALFTLLSLLTLSALALSAGETTKKPAVPDEPAPKKAAAVPDGTRVAVTMKVKALAQPKCKLFILDMLIPKTIPGRQDILDLRFSVEPKEVYERDGDRYAQFVLTELAQDVDITLDFDAEIHRYDLTTAPKKEQYRQMSPAEDLRKWLVHEQYLERYSAVVQEAARELNGKDAEETIRSCFDYTITTLKQGPWDKADRGAVWALEKKKGDCSEFADLFVTLCRARGIPARVCEGYLIVPVGDTPKHNWTEIYTRKFGWVPFDPFWAHLKQNTTFEQTRPIYLLLSTQRRNSVLNGYHFWSSRWDNGPVQLRDSFTVHSRKDLPGE